MSSSGRVLGWVAVLCAAGALAGGCAPKPRAVQVVTGFGDAQRADGLELRMELPKARYRIGEKVHLTIRATNLTERPIRVVSEGRDLVRVQAYCDRGLGWEQFRQFPAMDIPVRIPWTLAPGEGREWKLTLTVEPDWPSAQQVMLKAALNSGPDANPSVIVEIHPKSVKPQ